MTQRLVKLHCYGWSMGQISHAKETHPSDPPLIKMSSLEREACDNDFQEGKCAQQISVIPGANLQGLVELHQRCIDLHCFETELKTCQNSQVSAKDFCIVFF